MAGRPPLPIGQHGKIRFKELEPKRVRAYCQYRDLDGKTRQVSATGASESAAERALKTQLTQRSASGTDINGDTRFRVAAERWFTCVEAAVEAGDRSPNTAAQYRSFLDRHVLPGMGDLRLREATTGRVDMVLEAIRERSGAPTARSCRTVISGVLGWAVRHDAITTVATRDTAAISTTPKKKPRALTVEEVARWLKLLAADASAVRHDLLDLTAGMLATGVRVGEALAIRWCDLDLIGAELVIDGARRKVCTVDISGKLLRIKGRGLVRMPSTKTAAGMRTLRLPEFAVTMFRRRAVEQHALAVGRLDVVDPADAAAALGESPVYPNSRGGWRDPSNTLRDLRDARHDRQHDEGEGCACEFSWVTSHVFRKTAATMLDAAGLTARQIADVLGHAQISMTQDRYLSRAAVDPQAAMALESGLRDLFPMHKPCSDLDKKSQDTA